MVEGEALQLFGVTLIGATPENLRKLLLTFVLVAAAFLIAWALRALLRGFIGSRSGTRFHFWARQVVSLTIATLLLLGIASIWFDNPARLATVLGLLGGRPRLRTAARDHGRRGLFRHLARQDL